jgi:uncharacterized protein (UPF0548 family)
VYRLGSPAQSEIDTLLKSARLTDVTYQSIGATMAGSMPAGYRHDRHQALLANRPDSFEIAREGVRTWQGHRGIGATVAPDDPPAEGATVVVSLARRPLTVLAPCRVVAVVDEADRYGFAYGTLPGHPERGEEAFIVERRADGVRFQIVAFSRPADLLAKLGGPLTHLIQQQATRGYLHSLQRWVAARGPW